MASQIDASFVNVAGPLRKSAARDPGGLPGLQEALVQAATEISGVQGGTGIDMSGLTNVVPDLDDKVLFRDISGSVTAYATLRQVRGSNAQGQIITAPVIGLAGDGTDDAPLLNQAIATWSAAGGAFFLLRPADAGYFYFASPIFVRSGITLQFVGPSIRLAKGASIILNGGLALSPATNRLRLLADVTAGDATLSIDTSAQGGGSVSDFLAVADYLVIDGAVDAAGNSVEQQEVRVTAVDDGAKTVTIAPVAAFDFAVAYTNTAYEAYSGSTSRTLISRQVQTLLTGNITAGTQIMPVTTATKAQFAIGDFVLAQDDLIASDLSGSATTLLNIEPSRIVDIDGDGADTITLDRALARAMTTAKRARLTKLNPIVNAGIAGCTVSYVAAPDADVHPFEMRRAVGCIGSDCFLPNADPYGYRGNGFRTFQSIASVWARISVQYPRHLAAGQGWGAVIAYSRDCLIRDAYFAGCRRDGVAYGSTGAVFEDVTSVDNRYVSLSCEGVREYGTQFREFSIVGGDKYASSSRAAIAVGDTGNLAGAFDTTFRGGKIIGWAGADTYAVKVFAPSEDVLIDSIEIQSSAVGFYFADNPGDAALDAANVRFQNSHFNNIQSWIADCNGGLNGSSTCRLRGLVFANCHFIAVSKMFRLTQIDTFKLFNCDIDQIVLDPTELYIVKATDVTDLLIRGGLANKAGKGFSLTNCPDYRILGITLADLDGTEVLFDGGGNGGGEWRLVDTAGFTPTANLGGGSSMTFYPFPIGGNYLTDS